VVSLRKKSRPWASRSSAASGAAHQPHSCRTGGAGRTWWRAGRAAELAEQAAARVQRQRGHERQMQPVASWPRKRELVPKGRQRADLHEYWTDPWAAVSVQTRPRAGEAQTGSVSRALCASETRARTLVAAKPKPGARLASLGDAIVTVLDENRGVQIARCRREPVDDYVAESMLCQLTNVPQTGRIPRPLRARCLVAHSDHLRAEPGRDLGPDTQDGAHPNASGAKSSENSRTEIPRRPTAKQAKAGSLRPDRAPPHKNPAEAPAIG